MCSHSSFLGVVMDKQYTQAVIREMICDAQTEYSTHLAGKTFMYVYGEEYFEVVFKVACFKHLTGVESKLTANRFYQYAGTGLLAAKQFYFTKEHPRRLAIHKLKQLQALSVITQEQVCVLKEIHTVSFTYRLGLTNLDFTLCLTEDTALKDSNLSEYYVPQSFRVKDKSVENSKDGAFIDFIFEKTATDSIYDKLNFAAKGKELPTCLKGKISDSFYVVCNV